MTAIMEEMKYFRDTLREGELDTTSYSHISEPAEELCRRTMSTLGVRGWRSRLLEGDA